MVVGKGEHFERALRNVGAGGVDEDFDTAEFGEHAPAHRRDGIGVPNVARLDEGAGDLGGDGFEEFAAAAKQRNAPALLGEGLGDGGAHAAAGSGDDGGFFHRDQELGSSTHALISAERTAASMTAWVRTPSWKLGTQGRWLRMASMNSNAWS